LSDLKALRYHIEVLAYNDYVPFVSAFLPWSIKLLNNLLIKIQDNGFEHQLRNAILDIYSQLPGLGDALRGYVEGIVQVCLKVLETDTEENGLLALHCMIDCHKTFRMILDPFVQPFIDFVLRSFDKFGETCKEMCRTGEAKRTTMANASFKVLTECPVMVVLMFQLHRRFIGENIPKFIPLVIRALGVECLLKVHDNMDPKVKGLAQIWKEQLHPTRIILNDYISCQIKVLAHCSVISFKTADFVIFSLYK
jgi:transformation/transcription domain-associated protein